MLYFDPRQPNEATKSLGSGSGPVLVATGLIFGLVGLSFILARLGENGPETKAAQSIRQSMQSRMLPEVDISPFLYVPQIIKGVFMFLPAAIFLGVGAFFIHLGIKLGEMMSVTMGAICFAGGAGIAVKGILSIKEGLDIRKVHK